MEKKTPTSLFLLLVIASFFLFVLDRWGVLWEIRGGIDATLSPSKRAVSGVVLSLPFLSNGRITSLIDERNTLLGKLTTLEKLEKENEDLRMQLGIPKERGQKLILAHVLSTTRFFIIDKGEEDDVRLGDTVTFKNIFVGKIVAVQKKTSRVMTPVEKESILGAKARQTGARGLVKGTADGMIFSEVILSEKLTENDTIATIGDLDEISGGIRPDLLIGTLLHIRKSEDQLFQEADIAPLIDYKTLQNVFVIM